MIGIDVVEVARIERSLENPRFLRRVFSDAEILCCKGKVQSLAANFAGKEAFIKATGRKDIPLKKIEILRDENGRPYVKAPICENVQVSLSHEKTVTVAIVLMLSH
jgi:holo-[acyl-carrier-protein] synthase